ncbi:MAG: hypothetical protein AAB460_02035 [Patescibacteria group bacterium]
MERGINKKELLEKVRRLHKIFHSGKIPVLSKHEVNPGLAKDSRENYLYFTLPPCINFQRSSTAMWAAALKTYNDPETKYLFYPEEVVTRSRDTIQKDLLKHKLALQKNKHTDIWMIISKAFSEHFSNDPRELLKKGKWDVLGIHQIIQKDMKKEFPYISGPKMSNYWLYILSQYTAAKFANMQEISIIPDTHVLQCSLRLGMSEPKTSPLEVARIWKDLLEGMEISPVEMHPVLWNWSRNNFLPEV